MTKTTTAASATNKNKNDSREVKPYNRYNIYFILERQRFLQSNPTYKQSTPAAPPSNFITGYESLDLPDLPPRYTSLDLPCDWYMPGKRKAARRDHKKSHGLASFKDIARLVADGYKAIDDVTLEYVTTVAEILKQRHKEIKKSRRLDLRRSAVVESHRSSPSNRDTGWDERAQYYATQSRHDHWGSPPRISENFHVEATAPPRMSMSENFHVEATVSSCPYNTPPREYSPHPNECVGVDQRHKEIKKSRRLDLRRSAAMDSHRRSPSNRDTGWDERAQYYSTQPRHDHWGSPPRMSENFHVETTAPSRPYNTPPREYSPNPNDCVGVDASRSISEVDMDDKDIIRMWHYY